MGNKNFKAFDELRNESKPKTQSINSKDLDFLKKIGIKIKEFIGSGEVGLVFRGIYDIPVIYIRDTEGGLLDIRHGEGFALKYIDIKQIEENELRIGGIERMTKMRQFIEKEKQMRQKLINSDLLRVRICVNSGDYQMICLNSKAFIQIALEDIEVRPSFDRLYLLMNFSKLGNLDKYLLKLNSKALSVRPNEAKIWCKRLLSALKYLHDSNVFDVNIKPQNVLMFEEYISSECETCVVPKLSDFWVNDYFSDKTDRQSSSSDEESSEEKFSDKDLRQMTDIFLLADIFHTIISKTEFKSECNRVLALSLVQSMRDFSHKCCDQYLKYKWFESQEV